MMTFLRRFAAITIILTLVLEISIFGSFCRTVVFAEEEAEGGVTEEVVPPSDAGDETDEYSDAAGETDEFAGITDGTEPAWEIEGPRSAEIVGSGSCGDDITWEMDDQGLLTITGSGPMTNWASESTGYYAPWYDLDVRKAFIGSGITSVGSNAFRNWNGNMQLTEVDVPDTVTTFGMNCFYGAKIAEINIPDGTELIGNNAFYNSRLTELLIPDSVITIGQDAFSNISTLKRIRINKNMTNLGWVFNGCINLESYEVSSENTKYVAVDGVLFTKDMTELTAYPAGRAGSYAIPEGIKPIADKAFYYSRGLTSVDIPDSVTNIGASAFSACTGLEEMYVPDSVVSLGQSVFSQCSNLKKAVIGNGVTTLPNSVFGFCGELIDLTLSDNIAVINDFAFGDCFKLTEIVLPRSLNRLGDRIFPYTVLRVFFTGDAPSHIGGECFKDCKLVAYYDDTNPTWTQYSGTNKDPRLGSYRGRVCWAGAMADPDLPERMAGSKRQTTAVAISQAAFPEGSKNIVLASGDNYPDALAGAPLAYMLNAPILLICKSRFDQDTLNEIDRLGAENVYILGGAGAISENAAAILRNKGLKVERLAGSDRFETAVKIAEKMDAIRGGKPAATFFVYSHNYPDALTISDVAAITGNPILFVETKGVLRDPIKRYMDKCGKVNISVIIGGPALISTNAEKTLGTYGQTARLYGSNRYETGIAINRAFSDILDGDSICIASGGNYPDALAGSVLAAKFHAPLMLVSNSEMIQNQKTYLANEKHPLNVFAFGGTFVVPDAVIEDVYKYTLLGKGPWG